MKDVEPIEGDDLQELVDKIAQYFPTYTYFIGAASGPIKVGKTKNVISRLEHFRTGSPFPLYVYGLSQQPEHKLHSFLKRMGKQVNREWYDRDYCMHLCWCLKREPHFHMEFDGVDPLILANSKFNVASRRWNNQPESDDAWIEYRDAKTELVAAFHDLYVRSKEAESELFPARKPYEPKILT